MGGFDRVKTLIGEEGLERLKKAKIALFGIGGVGGFTAEALIRSGVGRLDIFDSDVLDETNLNRQIIANVDTVGKDKVSVMKERLLSVNPDAEINERKIFYTPENADEIDFSLYDYVIDAVDTVSAKISIIERAKQQAIPVISCMGTGGKLRAEMLRIDKIEKTSGCPLARVMRRELKNRGITGVKVVYSTEERMENKAESVGQKKADGRVAPSSMIFVPAVAGLLLAESVILDLIGE